MFMSKELPWTGERLVTTVYNETAVEHLTRYAFCIPYIKNKKVLDVACGEGYGVHLMASEALSVVGADIDNRTIEHANKKYSKDNVQFVQASGQFLPFADDNFDVVISFETIEHVAEQEKLLEEIARVLTRTGLLIISTPNEAVYSKRSNHKNPYHIKELNQAEFRQLLNACFLNTRILTQQNYSGSIILSAPEELNKLKKWTGDYNGIKADGISEAEYFVALASNDALPEVEAAYFEDAALLTTGLTDLKNTITYKTGALILAPIKWFLSLFVK